MGVTEVCGHLQPLLCLVIGIDAAGIPLEIRVVDNAPVIEVADAAVVAESVF